MEHRCASYLTFRAAWLRMWVASSLDKLVAMSRDEMNTRLRLLGSCTPLPTPQFAAKIDMLCKQFGSLWFSGGVRIQKVVQRANLARVVSCSSHIYIYHLCLLYIYIFFSSWCQPLQHWKGFLGSQNKSIAFFTMSSSPLGKWPWNHLQKTFPLIAKSRGTASTKIWNHKAKNVSKCLHTWGSAQWLVMFHTKMSIHVNSIQFRPSQTSQILPRNRVKKM